MRFGPMIVLLTVGLASCSSRPHAGQSGASRAGTGAAQASPLAEHHEHALHNVHRINDRLISGAIPESPGAFDELRAMGVKTIISVDGATPNVAAAEARGMRYVHIPTTYATVTAEQQLEIARAIRDLPGPVFLHCHHGKHRGPAAAASAAVALGMMTSEQGVEFMKTAGTAPSYAGLYSCVGAAVVASPGAISAAPDDFPAIRRVSGIVGAMVEVDLAFENLRSISAAGWKVPADHPDLVPAAEAGRLTDNLRLSHEDPTVASRASADDLSIMLTDAAIKAGSLEEAIVAGRPAKELDAAFKLVQSSCKDCHVKHRDGTR
ncbi:MAG: hypothetical protein H7Y88_05085 [Phycisphaerales bacterium]|nr:hypothetical protein [Phycisphaerales bacterium]